MSGDASSPRGQGGGAGLAVRRDAHRRQPKAELPRVWLLLGHRHGDNAQVRALAADLGWPAEEIALEYTSLYQLPNALLGASLISLRQKPAHLAPPWPDLVIAIGRRSVPAARWIREQSKGRTRLVHLGRPRIVLRHFDLVLTTAQYGVPDWANVVELSLPWQVPLSHPPATGAGAHVLAVLGGNSRAARLTAATVDALIDRARSAAEANALPLVVATSPRTPAPLAVHLRTRLGADDRLYDWAAAGGRDNPYRSDLARASETFLTSDSVSVLSDAVWTGRPATVIPAPERTWLTALQRHGGVPARAWRYTGGNMALGAPPPNLDALIRSLVRNGLARPDGRGGWFIAPCRPRLEAERREVLARLRTAWLD